MDPTSVPKATAARVAMIAISREVRAPWMRPASKLRPSESVPSRNSPNGGEKGLDTIANGLVGASGDGNDEGEPQQTRHDARVAEEALPEAVHQPTLTRGSSST